MSQDLFQDGPPWLKKIREEGRNQFEALGIPTSKNEAWKYTSVKSLMEIPFELGAFSLQAAEVLEKFPCSGFERPHGIQISFVNGIFAPSLSQLQNLPKGVEVRSLKKAWEENPKEIEKFLNRQAPVDYEPFAALNAAYLNDGAFIKLQKGVHLEEPIEVFYYSVANGSPTASHPRTLAIVEEGAQGILVETFAGKRSSNPYFSNSVTEIFANPGAQLDHYKFQDEYEQAFHLGSLGVYQDRDSRFTSTNVSIGSRLSRHQVLSRLDAEGAECTLNGLFMVHGTQHVDHQTKIDHAKPHGTSQEHYKGILADQAHGVFNGQILVRPGSQKTLSSLTSNNLLLSREAVIDTKPLLEIFADDVKCSHGATIGRLDENQIFYLRSRGLDETLAKHLLTYAFASEMVHKLKVPALRSHLEEVILNRLKIHELSVEGGSA